MKALSDMYGDELVEFYKFMCDEVIATTNRLKASLDEEWYLTASTFFGLLSDKMDRLKTIQEEIMRRGREDYDPDAEPDGDIDEEKPDREVAVEWDGNAPAKTINSEGEFFSGMNDAELVRLYESNCASMSELLSHMSRVGFGLPDEAYYSDAVPYWSEILKIRDEAERRGLCSFE